jgi:hypothetical protein
MAMRRNSKYVFHIREKMVGENLYERSMEGAFWL